MVWTDKATEVKDHLHLWHKCAIHKNRPYTVKGMESATATSFGRLDSPARAGIDRCLKAALTTTK